jgi:hypothetical protein
MFRLCRALKTLAVTLAPSTVGFQLFTAPSLSTKVLLSIQKSDLLKIKAINNYLTVFSTCIGNLQNQYCKHIKYQILNLLRQAKGKYPLLFELLKHRTAKVYNFR